MAEIVCKDLSLGYDGKALLEGLNFEVNSGDYLAIVGENGSGKSTLIKTMLSLLKPIAGSITFGDGLKQNEIGYLPQQTVVQKDFPASVFEVVLSGCVSRLGFKPFYSKEDKALARENIAKMGMAGFEKRSFKELSGGQKQRVLLARALCATEKVLLLDEPVSGLDPAVTAEMYELISGLNKSGTTVIMISHDIPSALKYANKILSIGSEFFFGDVKDYADKFLNKSLSGGAI